jgi:YD repeat-containing protein
LTSLAHQRPSADRNGAAHAVTYDPMGNPLTKTSTNGSQTITKTYAYDALGNLVSADDGNEAIT